MTNSVFAPLLSAQFSTVAVCTPSDMRYFEPDAVGRAANEIEQNKIIVRSTYIVSSVFTTNDKNTNEPTQTTTSATKISNSCVDTQRCDTRGTKRSLDETSAAMSQQQTTRLTLATRRDCRCCGHFLIHDACEVTGAKLSAPKFQAKTERQRRLESTIAIANRVRINVTLDETLTFNDVASAVRIDNRHNRCTRKHVHSIQVFEKNPK
jgi:septal ring factor EnvC (AmiA/AmiB activator)